MSIASWTWIQDRNVIPKPNFLNWTGLGWMSGATNCHLSGCLQLLVFEDEDVYKVLINIFHTSLCCVAVNRNVSFSFLVALWPCGQSVVLLWQLDRITGVYVWLCLILIQGFICFERKYSCFDSLIWLQIYMFDCVWSSCWTARGIHMLSAKSNWSRPKTTWPVWPTSSFLSFTFCFLVVYYYFIG